MKTLVDPTEFLKEYNAKTYGYTIEQNKFNEWAAKQNLKLITEYKGLKIGQKLFFKNGYDVPMVFKIIGLVEPDKYGNCIYLDWSCFWSPIGMDRIIKILEN